MRSRADEFDRLLAAANREFGGVLSTEMAAWQRLARMRHDVRVRGWRTR